MILSQSCSEFVSLVVQCPPCHVWAWWCPKFLCVLFESTREDMLARSIKLYIFNPTPSVHISDAVRDAPRLTWSWYLARSPQKRTCSCPMMLAWCWWLQGGPWPPHQATRRHRSWWPRSQVWLCHRWNTWAYASQSWKCGRWDLSLVGEVMKKLNSVLSTLMIMVPWSQCVSRLFSYISTQHDERVTNDEIVADL